MTGRKVDVKRMIGGCDAGMTRLGRWIGDEMLGFSCYILLQFFLYVELAIVNWYV